ncbi:MAG: AlkA N-terminal domain-containing protein [Microbacteriaceae bacterium]
MAEIVTEAGLAATEISFDLPFVHPYDAAQVFAVLSTHAIPGAEFTDQVTRSHTRLLPGTERPIATRVRFAADHIQVSIPADAAHSQSRIAAIVRRWLDLDADPERVYHRMRHDRTLGPLIAARPGVRVVGSPNGFEAAVKTVLGQQVSIARGGVLTSRLLSAFGTALADGLTDFPSPERLAAATPAELQEAVRLTGARARALHALAEVCANGLRVDPHGDHVDIRRRLLAVPGIGPWTVDYLAVRALGDRDAFAPGDLVLRRALGRVSAKQAADAALAWSPFRAYALFQLWTSAASAAHPAEVHGTAS